MAKVSQILAISLSARKTAMAKMYGLNPKHAPVFSHVCLMECHFYPMPHDAANVVMAHPNAKAILVIFAQKAFG